MVYSMIPEVWAPPLELLLLEDILPTLGDRQNTVYWKSYCLTLCDSTRIPFLLVKAL